MWPIYYISLELDFETDIDLLKRFMVDFGYRYLVSGQMFLGILFHCTAYVVKRKISLYYGWFCFQSNVINFTSAVVLTLFFLISGVNHTNIVCDGCHASPIYGTRWKCIDCENSVNLCSPCYHGDKHSLRHSFVRITAPDAPQ